MEALRREKPQRDEFITEYVYRMRRMGSQEATPATLRRGGYLWRGVKGFDELREALCIFEDVQRTSKSTHSSQRRTVESEGAVAEHSRTCSGGTGSFFIEVL